MSAQKSPPRMMSALDWVLLAASKDVGRPVLCGVKVGENELAATDGHRLHVAPRPEGLPEGLWNRGRIDRIEGVYPQYGQVISLDKATHTFAVNGLGPVITDLAKAKGFFALIHGAYFNPIYLRDALKGMKTDAVGHFINPLSPLTLTDSQDRVAVVMPVRVVTGQSRHADLTSWVGGLIEKRKPKRRAKKEAAA